MNLEAMQSALRSQQLDGWLFFDHHQRDPLAYRVLGFAPAGHVTRRWYYFIPAEGQPRAMVHRVEPRMLDALPGEKIRYVGWKEQASALETVLGGARRVAMQYSPNCAIPYVSLVDAGTVELVRGLGVEVVSSADLIQYFEARWDQAKLESHMEAGRRVDAVLESAFALVRQRLAAGTEVNELEIKHFIREAFVSRGLFTDHGPIVAVNANASNPHYEPTEESFAPIRKADVLLIDLWAKLDRPGGVYYDITWMAFCGQQPPERVQNVFRVVTGARDAAVRTVREAVTSSTPLAGYQVDDAARNHIRDAGFADYFVHRTGHSIGEEVHGNGANMDNLESHDERRIIPFTCFSVEPGVYLPEFGIRSEVNVFVGEREAGVTGRKQEDLVLV
jgi:Xaa-Pro dipeptidase